jgi:neuron navigator 2
MTKTSRQTSLSQLSESRSSLPPTPHHNKLPAKLPSEPPMMPTTNHLQQNNHGKPPISPTKGSHHQVTLIENGEHDTSLVVTHCEVERFNEINNISAKPIDNIDVDALPVVEDLKKQLREKDMVLTDIRLEALTQASQMENLKETVRAMRQEMMALKHNNDRLQKMVMTRSIAGSDTSLGGPASPIGSGCDSRRYSFATDFSRPPLELPANLDETEEEDNVPAPAPPQPLSPVLINDLSPTLDGISLSNEILTTPAEEVADPIDGKRISVAVYLGQPETFAKFIEESNELDHEDGLQTNNEIMNGFCKSHDEITSSRMTIANTYISGKTTWQNLDYIVRKTFKDYLSKIDPGTNLGLNTDSITSYHLGEAKRGPDQGYPELLPCGYIVGNVKTLYICLQGVGSLAFDTLIPRSIVHRYINLLTEHRRLILCGPSGTGKSYLARKLAEFLVSKSHRSNLVESIATFK